MQGTLITAKDQKLNDFLMQWLTDSAQPNLREKTYIRYYELITLHILPTLGKNHIAETYSATSPKALQQKAARGLRTTNGSAIIKCSIVRSTTRSNGVSFRVMFVI